MNTARLNFTRLNTSVLNASLLNSSLMGGRGKGSSSRPSGLIAQYKPYLNSNDSPTRETLKDYSGHGNDITLYNFAFTEESGYNTTTYPGALVSDGVEDYGSTSKPLGNVGTVIFMLNEIKWDDRRYLHNISIDDNGNRLYCWKNNSQVESGLPSTDTGINNHFITFTREPQYVREGWILLGASIRNTISVALYALEIYDRDLTEEEIETVKQRMMAEYEKATGNVLEPTLDPSLVDAWIFSGLKNYDAPEFITGEKGIQLEAHNFAWNEEGSGFKDGALWFDGVDDFLVNRGFPVLTDYTIIFKRGLIKYNRYAALASKYNGVNNGAFLFELNYDFSTETIPDSALSFDNANGTGHTRYENDKIPDSISWQTKNSYNGYAIGSGNILDGEHFAIGGTRGAVHRMAAKVYWSALYSVSLTESQIQAEIQKLETLWSNRLNN